MKTPKYTDLHRYPNGYADSKNTNIERTFDRVRKARVVAEKRAAETMKNVEPLQKRRNV